MSVGNSSTDSCVKRAGTAHARFLESPSQLPTAAVPSLRVDISAGIKGSYLLFGKKAASIRLTRADYQTLSCSV